MLMRCNQLPVRPAILLVLTLALALALGACSQADTKGMAAITKYGCGGCHVVPGIAGAKGVVGPSLAGFANHPQSSKRPPTFRGTS